MAAYTMAILELALIIALYSAIWASVFMATFYMFMLLDKVIIPAAGRGIIHTVNGVVYVGKAVGNGVSSAVTSIGNGLETTKNFFKGLAFFAAVAASKALPDEAELA